MTKKSIIQSCQVCGDTSNTIRFGAVSCRACSEFFRRNVLSGPQKTLQNCSKNCQISHKTHRKSCKTCRFQKCLAIGMLKKLVLSRSPVETEPEIFKSLLDDLKTGYLNLESARRKVFREPITPPRYCNHQEFDEVFSKDIDLVLENFVSVLREKSGGKLDENQEEVLADHFIVPFVQLETTYRSMGHPSFLLPNGNIFDSHHLNELYETQGSPDNNSKIILEPLWLSNCKMLKESIGQVQPDLEEMLFLSSLIFWDFGIPNQSDECIQVCQKMRNNIYQELIDHEKSKLCGISDHSFRIIEVMSVLQILEKAANIIKNCGIISRIYDLKGKKCPLYEVSDE
ncbi:unnamed protein product [Caenorhabditis brenneri]